MGRVPTRLVGERIGGDHRLPLRERSDVEVGAKTKLRFDLALERALERGANLSTRSKNHVPALQQRLYIGESDLRQHRTQVCHGELAAADVDGPQERDVHRPYLICMI